MVALGAVLADAKEGVKSGYDRGSQFSSDFPDESIAYGAELDEMGLVKKAGHILGYGVGEVLNLATFGILAYNRTFGLPSGGEDGDLEAAINGSEGEGRNGRYDAVTADDDEEGIANYVNSEEDNNNKDSNGRRRYFSNGKSRAKKRGKGSKLEESVNDAESISGDSEYVEVSVDDKGNIYEADTGLDNLEEYTTPEGENALRVRRYFAKKTDIARNILSELEKGVTGINGEFDEMLDELEERGSIDRKMLSALGGIVAESYDVDSELNISDEELSKYETAVFEDIMKEREDILLGAAERQKYFVALDTAKSERAIENKAYVEKARVSRENAENRKIANSAKNRSDNQMAKVEWERRRVDKENDRLAWEDERSRREARTEGDRLVAYNIKRKLVDDGKAIIIEDRGYDRFNIPIIKLRMDEDHLPENGR